MVQFLEFKAASVPFYYEMLMNQLKKHVPVGQMWDVQVESHPHPSLRDTFSRSGRRESEAPLTAEHLEDFAEMAGMEFLLIDRHTTVGDLKRELRWNDLYYHLAGGL